MTNHLVVAYDGNNTQWLDALAGWIKAWRGAVVAEYYVSMDMSIEVVDAELLDLVHECSHRLAGWVVITQPFRRVGAVTVDVHVVVRPGEPLEIDCAACVVFAVTYVSKGGGCGIGAFFVL